MNRSQKANAMIAIMIIAAVVLIAVVYFLQRNTPRSNMLNQSRSYSQTPSQPIQGDKDLTGVSAELDSLDLDSIDSELNQNNYDSSSF